MNPVIISVKQPTLLPYRKGDVYRPVLANTCMLTVSRAKGGAHSGAVRSSKY